MNFENFGSVNNTLVLKQSEDEMSPEAATFEMRMGSGVIRMERDLDVVIWLAYKRLFDHSCA